MTAEEFRRGVENAWVDLVGVGARDFLPVRAARRVLQSLALDPALSALA